MANPPTETDPSSSLDQAPAPGASGMNEAHERNGLGESSNASAQVPLTQEQADQILADLKTIKQNLLWVLLIAGFFAARSLIFHY